MVWTNWEHHDRYRLSKFFPHTSIDFFSNPLQMYLRFWYGVKNKYTLINILQVWRWLPGIWWHSLACTMLCRNLCCGWGTIRNRTISCCLRFLILGFFQPFQENTGATFQRLSLLQSSIRTTSPAYFEILVYEIDISNFAVSHPQRVSNVFQILAWHQIRGMEFWWNSGAKWIGKKLDQERFQ